MMARSGDTTGRWARLVVLACPAMLAAPVRAADDEIVGEVADLAVQAQAHPLDLGANFDANLFEQAANSWILNPADRAGRPTPTSSIALERGRRMAVKRIERIESACGIAPEQRRRLELALESDVHRFAALVDATRTKYLGRTVDMSDPAGQKSWHAFQQDVQQCRTRLRRMFDEGSLFATVLASTLDQAQRDCLAAERTARQAYQWRAMVLDVVQRLDDSLGLDQAQHELLVTALLARDPGLRSDAEAPGFEDSNLRRTLVLMVLAGGDTEPIRAAVSETQWLSLSQFLNQGRAMKSWIEQQGVLEGRPAD